VQSLLVMKKWWSNSLVDICTLWVPSSYLSVYVHWHLAEADTGRHRSSRNRTVHVTIGESSSSCPPWSAAPPFNRCLQCRFSCRGRYRPSPSCVSNIFVSQRFKNYNDVRYSHSYSERLIGNDGTSTNDLEWSSLKVTFVVTSDKTCHAVLLHLQSFLCILA